MEKRTILALLVGLGFLAFGYGNSLALDPSQPSGVQGLWAMGKDVCQVESGMKEEEGAMSDWLIYPSQPSGVEGLSMTAHRYRVDLTAPEKGVDFLNGPSQPSGVQGLWPANPETKC